MGTIATAQALMGYQYALQRDACRTCAQVETGQIDGASTLTCTKGQFRTHSLSVCNEYQSQGLAANGYRLGGIHPSGKIRLCQACRQGIGTDPIRCRLAADAAVKPNGHCDRFERRPQATGEAGA